MSGFFYVNNKKKLNIELYNIYKEFDESSREFITFCVRIEARLNSWLSIKV